jgi:hypothetical protein
MHRVPWLQWLPSGSGKGSDRRIWEKRWRIWGVKGCGPSGERRSLWPIRRCAGASSGRLRLYSRAPPLPPRPSLATVTCTPLPRAAAPLHHSAAVANHRLHALSCLTTWPPRTPQSVSMGMAAGAGGEVRGWRADPTCEVETFRARIGLLPHVAGGGVPGPPRHVLAPRSPVALRPPLPRCIVLRVLDFSAPTVSSCPRKPLIPNAF